MISDIPSIIGRRYRVLEELGRGSMGRVLRVQHLHTGEKLAMKVLLAHAGADRDIVERFKREARAPAMIKSENVVKIIDADVAPELNGAPFLVMELLDGVDLEQHLQRRGRLSPAEVVNLIGQIGRALDKAHASSIIHRDLKPANLFLHFADGRTTLKILDFGISKMVPRDKEPTSIAGTRDGTIMGTPQYMSPEQARGATMSHGPPSDIWSVGIITYKLLTGRDYWTARSFADLLVEILAGPMPAPSTAFPFLPTAFDAWFARSCNRNASARWSSAGEQSTALVSALGPLMTSVASDDGPKATEDESYLDDTAASLLRDDPLDVVPAAIATDIVDPNEPAPSGSSDLKNKGDSRQITGVYCTCQVSHVSGESVTPADLVEVTRQFRETCATVLGTVGNPATQSVDSGQLLYFGYPSLTEDDAVQAVVASFRIVDATGRLRARLKRDCGISVSVRIGVHTGHVVIDEKIWVDSPVVRSQVNEQAVQLGQKASANQIVVSASTQRLIAARYKCEPIVKTDAPKGTPATYRVIGEHSVKELVSSPDRPSSRVSPNAELDSTKQPEASQSVNSSSPGWSVQEPPRPQATTTGFQEDPKSTNLTLPGETSERRPGSETAQTGLHANATQAERIQQKAEVVPHAKSAQQLSPTLLGPQGSDAVWRKPARKLLLGASMGLVLLIGGTASLLLRETPRESNSVRKSVTSKNMPPQQSAEQLRRAALRERARAVLSMALADQTDVNLSGSAIREVGWLRDPYFGKVLMEILGDPHRPPELRANAAWALGRSGVFAATPLLNRLARDSTLDIKIWSQVLQSLCLLADPQVVLNEVGRAYLEDSAQPARRRAVAVIFAASDKQAQIVLEHLTATVKTKSRNPVERALLESDLMLGMSLALHEKTHEALAKLLKVRGKPTNSQILLALSLGEDGEPLALALLRNFIASDLNEDGDEKVVRARLLLARIDPRPEQCALATGHTKAPPQEQETLYASVDSLSRCKEPQQYLDFLDGIVAKSVTQPDGDPLLVVHAAAALLDILQRSAASSHKSSRPIAGVQDERAWAIQQMEHEQLFGFYLKCLRTALDTGAPWTARRRAAEQAQVILAERNRRRSEGEVSAKDKEQEAQALELRIQELQKSPDSMERIVGLIAMRDEKALQTMLPQEKSPELQQVIAEQIHTQLANEILQRAASGKNIAAMRAYGELRRRGEHPQPPQVDALAQYRSGSPEERVELIESLVGWPFLDAKPVLLPASRDGYVEVRRSTVRVISGDLADKGSQLDALGILRLMFADPDWLVQVYIRSMLEGQHVEPSVVPAAPDHALVHSGPPVVPPKQTTSQQAAPQPTPQTCLLSLTADDADVAAEVDGSQAKLPLELNLAHGSHAVTYLDDRGELRKRSLDCLDHEPHPLSLPISHSGQLLGEGIKLWNSKDKDGALDKFSKAQKSAVQHAANREAVERAKDVLARCDYYLAEVSLAKRQRPLARDYFDKFLRSSAASSYPDLAKRAQAQRDTLQSQLGRFVIKLLIDGTCQTRTVWAEPGEGKSITVQTNPPQTFSGVDILPDTETSGTSQCQ